MGDAPAGPEAGGLGSSGNKQPNEQRPTCINDLSPACFVAVFSRLSAAATARAMCVHPLWAEYLRDDILWRPYLAQVFARVDTALPDGSQGPSSRAAFQGWAAHFTGLPQAVVSRALHMWAQLDGWLQQQAPFVANSLRSGATAADVADAEERLGVKLPPSLAAVLRVHDGQSLEFDRAFDAYVSWRVAQEEPELAPEGGAAPAQPPRWHPSMVWGLFGGYAFYDHLASVRLFPLDRIVWWTRFFRSHQGTQLPPHLVVVGGSASLSKLLLVDVRTGDVAMGGPQEHLPAAPPSGEARDGVLRWMEEWARRLAGGWYAVDELGQDTRRRARGIVLFPVAPPHMAVAVTRGLQVRVSAVFAPEMCGEGMARYFFGYSVRFSLLSADEQRRQEQSGATQQQEQGPNSVGQQQQTEQQQQQQQQTEQQRGNSHSAGSSGGGAVGARSGGPSGSAEGEAPVPSAASRQDVSADAPSAAVLRRCQLMSRAWRILGPTGELSNEVTGEGVVGEYPLLDAGGGEFVYQSCTHQAERLGFMEGGFQFVEGTIARPEGPAFNVVCPRFELRVPDFIF